MKQIREFLEEARNSDFDEIQSRDELATTEQVPANRVIITFNNLKILIIYVFIGSMYNRYW